MVNGPATNAAVHKPASADRASGAVAVQNRQGNASSRRDVSGRRRLQLGLPLQYARSSRSGFGLWDVSGLLQRDGKSRVGQGIVWRQRNEGQCGCNGLLQPAHIAKGANESVVRFIEVWIRHDRRTEALNSLCSRAFGELVQSALREGFSLV